MRKELFSAIAILVVGLIVPAFAGDNHAAAADELLPPNAKPGECYARVFAPPTYRTETQTVLKSEAFERVEIIPARYQWVEERVLVKEASKRLEVVPATYEWATERVLVKPAGKKMVDVPATFETVTERVLDQPAHTVWKKGSGPITKIDNATGEIMCLVEVPASYKTVTKKVLKTPATTREVEIPAEYTTVRRQVMKTPPTTRTIEIPAEYKTVRVQKEVSPPQIRKTEIPAEYQTVTNRVKVSDGRLEWQPVLCQTNLTPGVVTSLQSALKRGGYYNGPIDGIIGNQTMQALSSYQRAKGLPSGWLTIESLQKLGVEVR